MCREGSALKGHPMASRILEQERMIGMKQILRKYEKRVMPARMREQEMFVQYIIKNEGKEGEKSRDFSSDFNASLIIIL